MKVVIVDPAIGVSVREGNGKLEFLQRCVGGLIQEVRWLKGFTVYANEEGLVHGLKENDLFSRTLDRRLYPDGVMGPVVILKRRGGKGMTDAEVEEVVAKFVGGPWVNSSSGAIAARAGGRR